MAEYSNLLWCFVLRLAKYRLWIVLVKVSINTYNTFGNRRVRATHLLAEMITDVNPESHYLALQCLLRRP